MAFTVNELEAITAYDHQTNPTSQAALLIDPSDASVALYTFAATGLPLLQYERLTPLSQAASDLFDERHASKIKRAVTNHYRFDCETDPFIEEIGITASELMNKYRAFVGTALDEAFAHVDIALESANIPQEQLRMLFVGSWATFFPAELLVRMHYSSAMPLVSDGRYASYSQTDEPIRQGVSLCQELRAKRLCGPVVWTVLQGERPVSLTLAEDGANAEEFLQCVFADTNGVLLARGGKIMLSVAGKAIPLPVPTRRRADLCLVNVGLQYADGQFSVTVKEQDGAFTETYPIDIQIKGA